MSEDGKGWIRLTRIVKDELEQFRLKFARCANHDVAPLNSCLTVLRLKLHSLKKTSNYTVKLLSKSL